MRKEGVIIVSIGLLLLLLSTNYNVLFNAFALFILAGGIVGTSFSLPENLVLAFTLAALIGASVWPFRVSLGKKFVAYKKRAKLLQSKQQ